MASTLQPPASAGIRPQLRPRVLVRCFRHYGDAERGYDRLRASGRIPDHRVTVVGRALERREDLPVGALYKVACWLAAAVGAVVGLVLWALGLTSTGTDWLTQTLLSAVVGVTIGFFIATTVARRRTGVSRTDEVEPQQYDILVDEEFVPAALEVLERQ